MFRSPQHQRTFLTLLMTYLLDLLGFSIVFPVLAPLLLNSQMHFFPPETSEAVRTTMLGLIFAAFGAAQFIGAPIIGVFADHYGRFKAFLSSIGLSIFGYAILAIGVYVESLEWMFIGRIVTGFCSGNAALAQSATADLTDEHNRAKAFGTLLGVGGLGFVIGPWVGGRLANPDWLSGSAAFIFAAAAAFINFLVVLFFFVETYKREEKHAKTTFFGTFKDLHIVFHHQTIRRLLICYVLFAMGWAFFLIFSPTFLVQRFSLDASQIGDIFAYMAVIWFFGSMFLNKELAGKFSLHSLVLVGAALACIGVFLFLWPDHLWPYWIIVPIALIGGALTWVNLSSLVSINASASMQGRAMGATGSMWSIGQTLAPIIAGPLAGWSLYAPLLVGSFFILCMLIYFAIYCKKKR